MSDSEGPRKSYEDVSVVMITKNEEAAIAGVIEELRHHLPGADVIVVDGSNDSTPRIAAELGAEVVPEPVGGPAAALLHALRISARPFIATIDADATYPVEAFPVMIDLARSGVDVVGADRLAGGRPSSMPVANYVANRIFNLVASLRTRQRIRDVHSGQRVYRREVIDAFNWDANGLAFPVDLLVVPARSGYTVREISVSYRDRLGETKLVRLPGTIWTLRRLLRPLHRAK